MSILSGLCLYYEVNDWILSYLVKLLGFFALYCILWFIKSSSKYELFRNALSASTVRNAKRKGGIEMGERLGNTISDDGSADRSLFDRGGRYQCMQRIWIEQSRSWRREQWGQADQLWVGPTVFRGPWNFEPSHGIWVFMSRAMEFTVESAFCPRNLTFCIRTTFFLRKLPQSSSVTSLRMLIFGLMVIFD